MILVLLGTQKQSFSRLLDKLENCIKNKIILDKVIVQRGHTKFTSDCMEFIDFISNEDFGSFLDKADIIITHGGVGSIINGLKTGKKIIAVPRLKEYGEHVNNHQVQIIENFDQQGFLKGIFDINLLDNALKNIDNFIPVKYVSNNDKMLKTISDFIDKN
jgi:UDP-N-acetylglucosamine transferase subunit ALG13